MRKINYRGIKIAHIICIIEGEGTVEQPMEQVDYVVSYADNGDLVTLGKIVPLSKEERDMFN